MEFPQVLASFTILDLHIKRLSIGIKTLRISYQILNQRRGRFGSCMGSQSRVVQSPFYILTVGEYCVCVCVWGGGGGRVALSLTPH